MRVQLLHTDRPYTGELLYSADGREYTAKPQGREIGAIRTRLEGTKAHTSSDVQTLAELIEHGRTIQGAQLRDKTDPSEDTDTRFLQQQLFCVDIDNDEKRADGQKYRRERYISTPEEILKISQGAGLEPCIIAESFSSRKLDPNGDPIPKYHVLYASDRPVKTVKESRQILLNLLHVFGGAGDEALKDPARIVFGTTSDKNVYYMPTVNTAGALLSCYQEPQSDEEATREPQSKPQSPKSTPQRGAEADPDYLLSMCDVNALTYQEWLRVSAAYKKAGGSQELWQQWSGQYTSGKKNAREQERENAATWKKLTGEGVTAGSLKYFAKQYSTSEYDSYMQALKPQRATKTKRQPQSPAQTESNSEAMNSEGTQSGSKWYPIPYPKGDEPENYVHFIFTDGQKERVDGYLLADNLRKTSHYIFVKGENPSEPVQRFWYEHGVYNLVNDEFFKNKLRERLAVYGSRYCLKRYIEEAFYQLTIDNRYIDNSKTNPDANIINFENGLLHLDTLELMPHTSEYISTVQIPCKWAEDKDLKDCPTFTAFVSHLANYDGDTTETLIEYMGAVLSNVNGGEYKKALFLRGAGNCGKSQYINLARLLLTDRYYAAASLEKLESRFGAYILYNRRLVGDPDTSYIKLRELKVFKKATGGDGIDLEQKGKTQFTYKYKGFLIFGCNELPYFSGDNGSWVYDRILPINCGNPVTEQERDPHILQKMYAEREAIVSVCVKALKRTIARKYKFTESTRSKILLAEYRDENDPIRLFIDDCCILREDGAPTRDGITTKVFYQAYCQWYRENGHNSPPTATGFNRALAAATDIYDKNKLIRKSGNDRYYIYTLTDEARRNYTGFGTVNAGNPYSTYTG